MGPLWFIGSSGSRRACQTGTMRVLDAGCGRGRDFALPQDAYVVGIDISSEALAGNLSLDEAICADIQTYPLPEEEFDLILGFDLLEHLDRPEAALENLRRALRPGGQIILTFPNLWSCKGLLTRFTPHRFHVWVYRRIFRFAHAGEEGYGPFPTRLRITSRRLKRFAARHRLVLHLETTSGRAPVRLWRPVRPLWRLLARRSEVTATLQRAPAYM